MKRQPVAKQIILYLMLFTMLILTVACGASISEPESEYVEENNTVFEGAAELPPTQEAYPIPYPTTDPYPVQARSENAQIKPTVTPSRTPIPIVEGTYHAADVPRYVDIQAEVNIKAMGSSGYGVAGDYVFLHTVLDDSSHVFLKTNVLTGELEEIPRPPETESVHSLRANETHLFWADEVQNKLYVYDHQEHEVIRKIKTQIVREHIDVTSNALIWSGLSPTNQASASIYLWHFEDNTISRLAEDAFEPLICSDEWVVYLKNMFYNPQPQQMRLSSGDLYAHHLPTNREVMLGRNHYVDDRSNKNSSFSCDDYSLVWISDYAREENVSIFDFETETTSQILDWRVRGLVSLDNNAVVAISQGNPIGYDLETKQLFSPCLARCRLSSFGGQETFLNGRIYIVNNGYNPEHHQLSDIVQIIDIVK